MKNLFLRLFLLGLIVPLLVSEAFCQEIAPKAKNVIVFIGDGMGFNSDSAGTYYRYGEAGKQRYHSFPVAIACTTFSRAKKDMPTPEGCKGYDPDVFWTTLAGGNQGTEFTRTTDSAAASTTLFSGRKTLNGKIGMNADDEPVEVLAETAARAGKKAGTVTTVPISHATPAGFVAHCTARGKMDEIFLQMAGKDSPLSVLMGTGRPGKAKKDEQEKDRIKRFLAVGGEETWKELQTGSYNGFTVLQKAVEINDLAAKKGTIPEKAIGLPDAKPPLATMTLAALNVLSRGNDKGFVLMVEGGAIDGANHGQSMKRNCSEHDDFSKAIDAAIDWIEANSSWDETLVVVTSDHETGQIWGPDTYSDDNENDVFDEGDVFNGFRPLKNNGRGEIPGAQYGGKGHTNALVPFWAKGPGAELFLKRIKGNDRKAAEFWNFSGDYIDNTDLFPVLKAVIAP